MVSADLEHLGIAPLPVFFTVTHTDTFSFESTFRKCSSYQNPVFVWRYPVHRVVKNGIDRIPEVTCFTPATKAIPFRVPDILRVRDRAVFCVGRMVFRDKKKKISVRRDGRPEFMKIRVDIFS